MERKSVERELKQRIQTGKIRREDVTRRLAELAFGKANDCVRLALEDEPRLDKLDLSLLSEVKRNDKGTVEIKLLDRTKVLEQLAALADNHLLIAKQERNGRTYTSVTPLDLEGRKRELARIIGGATITETTLKSAEEMLRG